MRAMKTMKAVRVEASDDKDMAPAFLQHLREEIDAASNPTKAKGNQEVWRPLCVSRSVKVKHNHASLVHHIQTYHEARDRCCVSSKQLRVAKAM